MSSPPYTYSASKKISYKSYIQDVEYPDVVVKTTSGLSTSSLFCSIAVTQYPVKTGMQKEFSVVLEQPIVSDCDDTSNCWGQSSLYIGTGTPIDPEDLSAGYTYDWDDIVPADMAMIYSYFSKTFKQDMIARGIGAGLMVSIYDRA